MQRKPYTRYSREFKLEAVRQAALGEKPKAQIARALGIRVGHLRDWRLQFEEEAAPRPRSERLNRGDGNQGSRAAAGQHRSVSRRRNRVQSGR